MNSFLSVDFETANPSRVSACSMGITKVVDGQVAFAEVRYIHPVGGYSGINISIHGITEDMTRDAPTFDRVFEEFRDDFENLPVVSYSGFDRCVFEALLDHYNIRLKHNVAFIDAYAIARSVIPGLTSYKLPAVAYSLGIPREVHHDAKCDALQCARVFLKISDNVNIRGALDRKFDMVESFLNLVDDVVADGVVETWEARKVLNFLGCVTGHSRILEAVAEFLSIVLENGRVGQTESEMLLAVLKYAANLLRDHGQDGSCLSCDFSVRKKVDVGVKDASPRIPDGWVPKAVDIPTKPSEHWEYVRANPFRTLTGANISITGEGVKISRSEAENLVTRLGANLKQSSIKNLDFCVVLGETTENCQTGKAKGARANQRAGSPVRLIDEDEFLKLVAATVGASSSEPEPSQPPPEEPEPQGEIKVPSFMEGFVNEFPSRKVNVPDLPPIEMPPPPSPEEQRLAEEKWLEECAREEAAMWDDELEADSQGEP